MLKEKGGKELISINLLTLEMSNQSATMGTC